MKKLKFIIVQNVVQNIPLAIALSVTASALSGNLKFGLGLLSNVLIGFVSASFFNIILPTQKMSAAIAGLVKQDPSSIGGNAASNVVMSFIFTVLVGLIMSFYNVPIFPTFIFALISQFIPLYIVCYIVSFFFVPLAIKAAVAATKD